LTEPSVLQRFIDSFRIRPASPSVGPKPGLYHYEYLEKEWPTRFHLRIDPDGQGLLLANAAQAAVLSASGVLMVRGLLEGWSKDEIVADVAATFPEAAPEQIAADLVEVNALIANLGTPGDNYPISNLDDPYAATRSRMLSAPLRADVVPSEPEQTRQILQQLWKAGIPQATILVQPDTVIQILPRIVESAGDLGMITGLRTLAHWLPADVLDEAANAGLDHLTLVYISPIAQQHDALTAAGDHDLALRHFARCHDVELCPVAQVPLFRDNIDGLDVLIAELSERGVFNISFFALACPGDDQAARQAGALPGSLPQVATTINEAAENAQVRYLWEPPVRFDVTRSLSDHIVAGPRTAGDVAIRVEADGTVYPARGPRTVAGNILQDTWEQIWHSPCFTRYRERVAAPTRCTDCPDLPICAADCPRDPRGWSDDTTGGDD